MNTPTEQPLSETPVRVSIGNGVAEIRFNRPDALNTIDVTSANAFLAAVRDIAADNSIRVIILSGEGRSFMAGGDLAAFKKSGENAAALARQLITPMHEALKILASLPMPVIAAVQGDAAGAGMSVALAADLVVASDDARFRLAYTGIGVSPDCGGSWNLVRAAGLRQAMAIALLNESINAEQALRIGIVNKIVQQANLRAEVSKMAHRLAVSAPVALAATKALLRKAHHQPFDMQLDAEQESFEQCASTQDFREALDAFFARRPPNFTGK